MERTESTVVSVSPDYENDRIQEMSLFGWNLQGRQEIIGPLKQAETPDNLLVAIGRGMREGATNTKTYVRDHYVKLHFVRSLELPNLRRIKELENELAQLAWPASPSVVGPYIFTVMPIPGGIMMLLDPMGKQSPGLVGFVVALAWFLLGVRWIMSRGKKRRVAAETRASSEQRALEIRSELVALQDYPRAQHA